MILENFGEGPSLTRLEAALFRWVWILSVCTLAYGQDFRTWRWRNPLPSAHGKSAFAHDGERLVVVGNGSGAVSPDGLDWTFVRIGAGGVNPNLLSVAYGNGKFVAITPQETWGSDDGLRWSRLGGCPGGVSIAFGAGTFVVAGLSGIFSSPDGFDWVAHNPTPNGVLKSVTYAHGKFIAVGGYPDVSFVVTSSDGENWSGQIVGEEPLGKVIFGNGEFVAFGEEFVKYTVYKSLDGIAWTKSSPPNWLPEGVVFHDGMYVGANYGAIWTSTDAIQWTTRFFEPRLPIAQATFFKGLFVVSGGSSFLVSNDGVNWWRPAGGPSTEITDLAEGNGKTVAIGIQDHVLSSADSINWETHSLGPNTTLTSIAFGNGRFTAIGRSAGNRFFESEDGKNWTSYSQNSLGSRDIGFGGGAFVTFGRSLLGRPEFLRSTERRVWTAFPAPTERAINDIKSQNGMFIAAGDAGTILKSEDRGLNWSVQDSPTGTDLVAVAFGDDTILIVASDGTILISSDGAHWTVASQSSDMAGIIDAVFGNGQFVCSKGNRVFSSSDGRTWRASLVTELDYIRVNALLPRSNSYIAVGTYGAILESQYFRPPRFLSIEPQEPLVLLTIASQAGRPFTVELSQSLAAPSWFPIGTHQFDGETNQITDDTFVTWDTKFYRISVPNE